MKSSVARTRYRAPLVVISALAFLGYAVWSAHTPGEPRNLKDFLFVIGLFGPPFVLLVLHVWFSVIWNPMTLDANRSEWRARIAVAGSAMGTVSAGLLVLAMPLWEILILHDVLGSFWVIAGILTAVGAIACGILGPARYRLQVIFPILLVPFWLFVGALFTKAAMDLTACCDIRHGPPNSLPVDGWGIAFGYPIASHISNLGWRD